ncbi:MAG TPA: hypothetical protein VL979_13545 [Solirubrobacteraceae bacterium]|nr:hypothetical protein [Solirubrobacteraceae bacterium]
MPRLRAVSVAVLAAAALGGPASSGASALVEAVAAPSPATQQTYQFYLDGERFGSVVVDTATHKCTFAELPEAELETKAVCSLGSGESSISAWLHIVDLNPTFPGEDTFLFTVHRRLGPVAYSGLGLGFFHDEGIRRTVPIWIELET